MPLLILIFLASLIPVIVLYFWLRNLKNMPEGHKETSAEALKKGALSCIPVVFLSLLTNIALKLTKLDQINPLLYRALYDFLVLALVEETVKYTVFRKVIRNKQHSWLTAIIYMVTVGIGFEIVESVIYAIDSNPMQMIVRGVTMMHAAFGFIIGYYYGKAEHEHKKGLIAWGFVLSWLLHGTYDFCLSEEASALGDVAILLPVTIAFGCLVLMVCVVVFINKARKKERYITVISQENS